jgi:hypothetical protein
MISPIATRYGVAYCTTCDLTLVYCRCAVTQAARALAQPRTVEPMALVHGCRICGKPHRDCRCGATAARDEVQ